MPGDGFGVFKTNSLMKRERQVEKILIGNREKAFLSSEFKDYNPRVEHHVSKLVKRMENTEGKEVNVSGFMDDFVFDVYVCPVS